MCRRRSPTRSNRRTAKCASPSGVSSRLRLRHLDPGIARQPAISVLDAVEGPGGEVGGAELADSVELDQPGLISRPRCSEPGAYPISDAVPQHERLRPGAPGGGAHAQDFRERTVGLSLDQPSCLLHQERQLEGFPLGGTHRQDDGRLELEGAHGAMADVEELLHRAHRVRGTPTVREVLRDHGIAEAIG